MPAENVQAYSGEQWTLRHGEHEVTVVEVGGGIRQYTHRGLDVLAGYPLDVPCSAGRGQLLMPWPNRITDGKFSFDGRSYQLALSEPARQNAIHGLVRWDLWSLAEQQEDRVRLTTRLRPQQGWAWFLDLEVTYALDDTGLTVSPRAVNVGPTAAPFGFGAHPYFTVGEERVDELEVVLPASTYLRVDDERLLPLGRAEVDGSEKDLREPALLGTRALDTAYTDLAPDDDGRWRARVRNPANGRRVDLWAEASAYPWLQIFTGDSLPPQEFRCTGVAIEPMTGPPDAFNSGEDLVVLEPGASFTGAWGVSPS